MIRPRLTVSRDLLRLTEIYWFLDPGNQSSRARTDASTQAVRQRFPVWKGQITTVLRGDPAARWAGLVASARGVQGVLRVPMIDLIGSAGVAAPVPLTFEDGLTFDGGAAFERSSVVAVATAAARGDRSVLLSGSPVLRVGQVISRNDWPHRITAIRSELSDTRVSLEPGLFEDWSAGARVDLSATGLFVLADDEVGASPYKVSLTVRPSLELVQWVQR